MAAKLAHPDRQVILLSGDGAFGFSAMEFDTMVRHRIPVVCVVGNNGIWALEKHPMMSLLGVSIAADLGSHTRYDKVVEALGGHGELVERPDQIGPALERAFRSGLPACINTICDPDAEYPRSSVLM
jgi:acetolactate synthase-1/2/3 large subunit